MRYKGGRGISVAEKLFAIQKKIVGIMFGAKCGNSGRGLIKRVEILPLLWAYMFSLMNFIVNKHKPQIKQYMVLIQGMKTIFTDLLPTFDLKKNYIEPGPYLLTLFFM
jgi:hypothetical protein